MQHATEYATDILRWCGDDEVILVADSYFEYLEYDMENHCYFDQQGRRIIMTGSAYTSDRDTIRTALDSLLNNGDQI